MQEGLPSPPPPGTWAHLFEEACCPPRGAADASVALPYALLKMAATVPPGQPPPSWVYELVTSGSIREVRGPAWCRVRV